MNVRFLSVFIIIASISIMLFTFFITEPENKSSEPTPPFFYTIAPKDMNKIHIKTNNLENSWYFDSDSNRSFFENLNRKISQFIKEMKKNSKFFFGQININI